MKIPLNSHCINSPIHNQEFILDFLIDNYFCLQWNHLDFSCTWDHLEFRIYTSLIGLPFLTITNLKTNAKVHIDSSTKVLRLTELLSADMRSYEERKMLREIVDYIGTAK